MQVAAYFIEIESGDEDLGEAVITAAARRRGVDCEGRFVEVALELEPGLVNKRLVVGVELNGRNFDVGSAQRTGVNIEVGLGIGKQANWLGWSGFSQENGKADCYGD